MVYTTDYVDRVTVDCKNDTLLWNLVINSFFYIEELQPFKINIWLKWVGIDEINLIFWFNDIYKLEDWIQSLYYQIFICQVHAEYV